ncbi:MAG: PAS domain S-box protein, partial [Limisphaerales bacterium]
MKAGTANGLSATAGRPETDVLPEIFFKQSPTPMWIFDEKTLEFLAVNDAAVAWYGYSPEEFMEMRITDIRPPEDVHKLLALIERLRTELASSSSRWCHRKKDGTVVEVQVISTPIVFRHKKARLVQIFDVSEEGRTKKALKESEGRYRAVVDSLPYGMVVSIDDRIEYVNNTALKMAGLANPSELIGRSVLDFVHKNDLDLIRARRAEIARTGKPMPTLVGKVCLPTGRTIEAEMMGLPIVYGGHPAMLNCFRDVTEEVRWRAAIQTILNATTGVGEDFFRGLAAELTKALNVRYALVAQLVPGNPNRARTIVVWANGAQAENFEYDLAGTPCAVVMGKKLCQYSSDVQRSFPQDKLLVEMGVSSYLGIPLLSAAGSSIGLLSILDDAPMVNSELATSLMTIFAGRAGSELERITAIESLRASEKKYRQLHESMMDAYAAVDLSNGRIVDCNDVFRKMVGYEPDELCQMTYSDITPAKWHPMEAEIVEKQVLARGYSDIYRKEYRRKDGTIFPVELRASGLKDDSGRLVGMWAIVRDITERDWAEGLLAMEKRVLEWIAIRKPLPQVLEEICRSNEQLCGGGMMSSILLMDPDGRQLWPTASGSLPQEWVQKITPLGIGRGVGACGAAAFEKHQIIAEDIATDPSWTCFPDYLEVALRNGLRACWSTPIVSATGQVLGTFAMYYREPCTPRPKDLELLRQTTHLASVAIEQTRASEALKRARDEMEQRVRDRTAELSAANERLSELDRLKSLFLAGMSHELRTPLNSIIGFASILYQGFAGPVNEEQKKQLGFIRGSGTHLLSLVNDLLDLSRIEAGKVDLDVEEFDFEEVVKDVVENLRPMVAEKKLRFTTKLSRPVIKMQGDRKRCFQVLLNLANNAVKFTQRGSVEIEVTTTDKILKVSVVDTGIGIKPEQMEMLFEAFRQLDDSAKKLYEGTGLGLYLCRKLLTLMHGEIGVASVFGQGSRFTFSLPLRNGRRRVDSYNPP